MKPSHSITLKIPTYNVQTTHCMSGFLSFKGDTKKFDNAPQVELCLALYVAQLLHFLHFKEFVDAAKMFAYLSTTKLIHTGNKSIEEVTVVAHANKCAIKVVESLL